MTDDAPDHGFAFQGRTAAEYRQFFDLDPAAWGSILDCGAGPGSFAAEAGDATRVVAADVAYAAPLPRLRDRARTSVERVGSHLGELTERFDWTFYGDVDGRIEYLERAHDRFFADFGTAGRYVAAALPDLPFRTGAFDLALTAHLLFMYENRLDERFHVRAVEELCRVAREVRIYPLVTLGGHRAEYVDPVVERLAAAGHDVERRSVPFEFQRGADEMLVVVPS